MSGLTMELGKHLEVGEFRYYFFPNQLPCFLLGVYCYRLNQIWPALGLSGMHKTALMLTLTFLFFGFVEAETAPIGIHVLYVVFFALALTLTPIRSRPLVAQVLQSLGQQSYALFLSHIFLLKVFYTLVVAGNSGMGLPLLLALNLTVAIPLSWLLSWVIFNRIDRWCVERVSHWLRSKPVSPLGEFC